MNMSEVYVTKQPLAFIFKTTKT